MNFFRQLIDDIVEAIWYAPQLLSSESTGVYATATSQI